LSRQWFYRDDIANWVRVTDFAAEDESPLPREFDHLMIKGLAVTINPRYGAATDQSVVDLLGRVRKQFRARYRQNVEKTVEDGLLRMPSRRDYLTSYYSSSRAFDRGL
jgi:hypothetical protein